ncbi:hypothetical protein GCM10027168_43720 [Streptomyces capparidis]
MTTQRIGPGRLGGAVPMPPLDAWLHRHQSSGAVCMNIGLLMWFRGEPPTPEELAERVRHRWGRFPRLRLVPEEGGGAWPRWAPARDADPARHVVAAWGPAGAGPAERAAALLARPLPHRPSAPPWQLHLLPAPEGFALLLLAHHALLDGMSTVTLARTLLDGPGAHPAPPAAALVPHPRVAPGAPVRAVLRAATDVLPKGRPLPMHREVDAHRVLAWSELPESTLRAARDALPAGRATANAVFLAATGTALRATGLLGRRPWLPGVCAMVPVDLRSTHDACALGNHYATIRVPLPTSGGPAGRLLAVDGAARRALRRGLPHGQAVLVDRAPREHGGLRELLGRYADSPRYASLLCTNVRTAGGALALGAAPAVRMTLFPSLSPRHPLAVSLTTHDGVAVVGVLTDRAHGHAARPLADRIRREVEDLRAAAR